MKLTINGQSEDIHTQSPSISDLLKIKNVEMPEMVSVEHNGEMVDRASFDTTLVKENDDIEFLYFMRGGF